PADLSPVAANVKAPGFAAPNVLSVQLAEVRWAQGSSKLENPQSGVVSYFGYDDDGPMVPLPSAPTLEAHKTEPDKNTYLVFKNGLMGADPAYNYGTQFLFQGHEGGSPGYITRINLDADGPHRVTLLATQDSNGVPAPDDRRLHMGPVCPEAAIQQRERPQCRSKRRRSHLPSEPGRAGDGRRPCAVDRPRRVRRDAERRPGQPLLHRRRRRLDRHRAQ